MYLTDSVVELEPLLREVEDPAFGGVAAFVGRVRDHHAGKGVRELSYSAYHALAEREAARIVTEAEQRWTCRVALRHRLGVLQVGEVAVAVVAAAAHRDAAFEACRWVIDEVKRRVPVWKREQYADGSEAWVDPTAPDGAVPVQSPRAI